MYINIYMDFGTLNYWLMKRTIEDIIMKINIDFIQCSIYSISKEQFNKK